MIGGLLIFDTTDADVARLRFGGLRLVERQIRTMARAGVRRLLVVLPDGVQPRLGAVTERLDLELEFVTRRHGSQQTCPRTQFASQDTVLVVLGDHAHHHTSLRALVDLGRGSTDLVAQVSAIRCGRGSQHKVGPAPIGSVRVTDTGMELVAQTETEDDSTSTGAFLCAGGQGLFSAVASSDSGVEAIRAIGRTARSVAAPGDSQLWQRVRDRASGRRARAMLFGQVTKKTSGPVSRHINARLSIPISKVLIETGISPHMVTVLFVLTSGLTTAWLIARPESYGRVALAGVFWQMAAVLDRCDGEIARVKLCESKFGAWFDTVTDNIAYLATYVAFLLGVHYLHPDKPWALYAGFSAIAAMIVALGIMYNYALKTGSGSLQNYLVGFRAHVPASEKNTIYRLLERYAFIAKRDFFAFVHFLCCIVGSFELLYAYTVGGLHLIVLAVLISQRKMLEGHRRLNASPAETASP